MSENMEIFTHRRNLLEFENRNRVKIAKKSTFYEIPKWVNKLVENQRNALLPSYDTNKNTTTTPPLNKLNFHPADDHRDFGRLSFGDFIGWELPHDTDLGRSFTNENILLWSMLKVL